MRVVYQMQLLGVGSVLITIGCASSSSTDPSRLQEAAGSGGQASIREQATTGNTEPGTRNEIILEPEPSYLAPYYYTPPEPKVVKEWDLTTLLPEGSRLVGVSRDPEDNTIYVLDEQSGIYQVAENSLTQVYAPGDLSVDDDLDPKGMMSDLVALGKERFAVTWIDEGYMLDLPNAHMWRHFCYLPNIDPYISLLETSISVTYQQQGIDVWQGTSSLTLQRDTGLLWAAPRTFVRGTDEVKGTELASFDYATGEPTSWWLFDVMDLEIGGMAILGGNFLLATNSQLIAISESSQELVFQRDLPSDLAEITGMHANEDGTVLVTTGGSLVLRQVDLDAR